MSLILKSQAESQSEIISLQESIYNKKHSYILSKQFSYSEYPHCYFSVHYRHEKIYSSHSLTHLIGCSYKVLGRLSHLKSDCYYSKFLFPSVCSKYWSGFFIPFELNTPKTSDRDFDFRNILLLLDLGETKKFQAFEHMICSHFCLSAWECMGKNLSVICNRLSLCRIFCNI